MKKIANLLAGACAVLLCAAAPAFAETEENDPAEDDVVMLYTDKRANHSGSGSGLCDVINNLRSSSDAPALTQTDALMEKAAERVAKLSENNGNADVDALESAHACETVIRGRADLNTAICSMIISEQQSKPLLCSSYTQFGYACTEDETLWVFLFTE